MGVAHCEVWLARGVQWLCGCSVYLKDCVHVCLSIIVQKHVCSRMLEGLT